MGNQTNPPLNSFEIFFKRRVAAVNGLHEAHIKNVFVFGKNEKKARTDITFSIKQDDGGVKLHTVHLRPSEVGNLFKHREDKSLDQKLAL